MDKGEQLLDALAREVKEEIGYELREVVGEIGSVEEFRYYVRQHQISYAYLVKVGSFVGTEPTENELRQGIETRWYASIDEVISHIESAAEMDENDDEIGGIMMHARDIAILNEAKTIVQS